MISTRARARKAVATQERPQFRVYYKRVDESVGTYSMDHTGAIYLMDKTGQFTASLSFKTEDSVAIERLRSLATS